MKTICLIVFSANRPEYLIPTLESLSNLDFEGFSVKRLLIDDYPLDRNDDQIIAIAHKYDFDCCILHEENWGITKTWTETWKLLAGDEFDYIFMHEDDATHTRPVKVADMVDLLESDPWISQVELGRPTWYGHEKEPQPYDHTSFLTKDNKLYMYEICNQYFWMMCSLCRGRLLNIDIAAKTGNDLSESVVADYLHEQYRQYSAILRDNNLDPLIDHIGEYSQGVRISKEGDPGWDRLGIYKEGHKYCSRTGKILNGDI